MRNPRWQRDELILALALYVRAGRRQLDAKHHEVIALSSVLNRLGVHDGHVRGAEFRNPNGVAMKLGNFASVDPDRAAKGLTRGNALEHVVWQEFANDPERLHVVAAGIAAIAKPTHVAVPIRGFDSEGNEEEFPEGKLLTRLHIARERNQKVVRAKKSQVLASTGRLQCEACGFDFLETYGTLGAEFTECHHRTPLAELSAGARTTLADLAIVCANCHRMIHKARPVISVEELRLIIIRQRSGRAG